MALAAVTSALVLVSTYTFRIPIPATQGYFNLGDIMIFISAFTFGPVVGGVAGGVGSAIADILAGPIFAPFTLIIKGFEGYVAGYVARRGFRGREGAAWLLASVVMVGGYFIAESFLIALFFGATEFTGFAAALGEVPFNLLQVFAGGAVGLPLSRILKNRLPAVVLPARWLGAGMPEKKS